ncbi:hypothetical protein DEU56DRAFT_970757 [Suillus clintonianus]|uniref:uncharacterized protein n=1 Tax=Suillus clintonianus TaxID=1904413 RepID=UPI001B87315B|nr:uncharacterized protein DEU56DRAFT_970757 [Suillus clintonianus]KAG2150412.1 hypothetical protein DEU56DRAFT_970757 [Suillus clintonianus]
MIRLADIPLPAFLDPLLGFLAEKIPPPLYSFLLSFLSHSLALFTALISLISSIISSKPWQWNAQTIIPPLISFLAAYLALVSLYRTTSWMVRTSIWFIKWGTILGALTAGLGWYMGNQNAGVGNTGVVSSLGGFIWDVLNSQGQSTPDTQRSSRTPKTRTQRKSNDRPRSWESFEKHKQWQYQERGGNQEGDDAQKIMSNIMKAANRVITEGGWWDVARGIFDGPSSEDKSTTRDSQNRDETKSRSR